MSQRSKSRKKFFVKEEDGIFSVYQDFFDDIESRDEALAIALRTLGEVHSNLLEETEAGHELYIGNMKVSTGLKRTLDELDVRWPGLTQEIFSVPRKINGHILSMS